MERQRRTTDRRGTGKCRSGHLAVDPRRGEADVDGDDVGDDDADHLHRVDREPRDVPRDVGVVQDAEKRRSDWA